MGCIRGPLHDRRQSFFNFLMGFAMEIEALQYPLHFVDFWQGSELHRRSVMLIGLQEQVPIVLLFGPAVDVNGLIRVPSDEPLDGSVVVARGLELARQANPVAVP